MAFFSNDYPARMPFFERIGKELRFRKLVRVSCPATWANRNLSWFTLIGPASAPASWPTRHALGWAVTNRRGHRRPLFRRYQVRPDSWRSTTAPRSGRPRPGFWKRPLPGHQQVHPRPPPPRRLRLRRQRPSKDPQRTDARKNPRANAVHDGREIEGPLAAAEVQPGKVYQRIIDNRTESGPLRRPARGGHQWSRCPWSTGSGKSGEVRYTNENGGSRFWQHRRKTVPFPRRKMVQNRIDFRPKMRADFAELDILRDRQDGRIYCVDLKPHALWTSPRVCQKGKKAQANHAHSARFNTMTLLASAYTHTQKWRC